MTTNYQKVWNTMNELEMVISKVCSAREILDCALNALESHNIEKTEALIYAAHEFLGYYLSEFDDKFKDAWKETVVNNIPKPPSLEDINFVDLPKPFKKDNLPKKDKVIKWSLPVEEIDDEYYITLPEDLMEESNFNPGDEVEWVDQNNGSFLLRKVIKPLDKIVDSEMLFDSKLMVETYNNLLT